MRGLERKPVSWKDGGVDSRVVALRIRGREIPLADGRYVIGRGADCDVMVDDPRASRRHAALQVFGRNVSILDLMSANGTKRNGRRLPAGPQVLVHGDVIRVGREEIRVVIAAARPSDSKPWHSAPAETPGDGDGAEPPPEEFEDSSTSTRQSAGVQLVLVVGGKALEEGKANEAQVIVRPYLVNVMRGAIKQQEAAPGVYSDATAFALRLAIATGNGEWFDYAIELLRLRKTPCSAELARQLLEVVHAVESVDPGYLEDYRRALRDDSLDEDSVQRTQWLDGVIREVRRAVRPSGEPDPRRGRATIPDIDLQEKASQQRDRE
jgi:hypothetical protein